jgi:Uma2 family endonuclease
MEIVSPDSESRDWRDKYIEYERAGVREYWIIDPMSKNVEVYVLRRGRFVLMEERNERITSGVIRGFWLKTEWLWQRPLPSTWDVLRELGVE